MCNNCDANIYSGQKYDLISQNNGLLIIHINKQQYYIKINDLIWYYIQYLLWDK